ncbi:MAG: hypothetical protein AAFO81_09885 [Pseudomonadota bacterium]
MLTAARRRGIGIASWFALMVMTGVWLWDAGASIALWAWLILLVPFVALLPGLLKPTRNAFLLALLATIGYASLGLMDVIANPGSFGTAAALSIVALAAFFLLIPGVRTMPAPPKPDEP